MSSGNGRFIRFWQELKRRRVFGVIGAYAATAYIVIEVTNNLIGPLNLPDWVATLVVLLLLAGLPVAVILSWIFDFTPQGIRKTESYEESRKTKKQVIPSKKRVKASYLLNAILLIAVILLLGYEILKPDPLERLQASGERLSVAVMPFRNITNDTIWNVWQDGIQNSLISALSNIGELKVRQQESINKLLNSNGPVNYAVISPVVAGIVSKKLDADIFVYGDILKGGSVIRLNAQLVGTKTREVLKSIEIDGPYKEEEILVTIDSLKKRVTDFLVISKLIKGLSASELPSYNVLRPQTSSAEAYRYYLIGRKAFLKTDFPTAREWYLKALAADSNFFTPRWELSWAYGNQGIVDTCLQIVLDNYKRINQLSYLDQLFAKWSYVVYFEPPEVGIRILRQIIEIDDQSPTTLIELGNFLGGGQKGLVEYEKAYQIFRKWGKHFLINNHFYETLIKAYLEANQLEKAKKILKEAERYNPDKGNIINQKIIIAAAEKDTAAIIRHYKESQVWALSNQNFSRADSVEDIGWLYSFLGRKDSLLVYFRKALELDLDIKNEKNIHFTPHYQRLIRFVTILEERSPENFDFDVYSKLIDKLMGLTKDRITYYDYLDRKGWTFYQKGRPNEALEILQRVWDEAPYKFYSIKSHFEEVKKVVGVQGH